MQHSDNLKDADGITTDEKLALFVFSFMMTVSSLISFVCMNDFLTLVSFYVMTPAEYIWQARQFTIDRAKKTQSTIRWFMKLFRVDYGYKAFYTALKTLLIGMNAGLYLAYPASTRPYVVLPCILVSVFLLYEMEYYNEAMHWHSDAFPSFAVSLVSQPIPNDEGFENRLRSISCDQEDDVPFSPNSVGCIDSSDNFDNNAATPRVARRSSTRLLRRRSSN